MAKICVIIPAYNPGAYIEEAVQSVIAQTFTDWECLIVDDGSSEDLSRFDSFHPQVKLLRQPNRGVSAARNLGILSSQSDYIALLDADDAWLPDKLKSQVEMLDARPEMGFCHTAMNIMDEKSQVSGLGWAQPVISYRDLLDNAHICTSTVLMRRACMAESGLFDPLLRATQDYDLWLKLARFHEVGFVAEPLALYRVHSGTLSGDTLLMVGEGRQISERHLFLASRRGDKPAQARIRATIRKSRVGWGCVAFDKSRLALRHRDFAAFGHNFSTAVQLAPLYILRQALLLPQHLWSKRR